MNDELAQVRREWQTIALAWLPRLITQIDRDPTSSTYGCADRNWWHYKIRDFPSIILQQAGYTLWLAAALPEFSKQADGLRRLAAASARFWAARARRRGAFEEYYPNEQGYPPLAFSTLAAIKLTAEGAAPKGELRSAFERAARQLTQRFESEATNQQVAGIAALSWIRREYPQLVTGDRLESITRATLDLQNGEGWYREYGGPDLGYLSVTMDCLWDAYDATGDHRFRESAQLALDYLESMTRFGGASTGMLFARNTDYILPYGIARFCRYGGEPAARAARVLILLFADAGRPDHFLRAIDDRYVGHYAGHSLVRALSEVTASGAGVMPAASRNRPEAELYFTESGHFVRMPDDGREPALAIALRKGGVITMRGPDGSFASDYGWSLPVRGGRAVTHWWSDHWRAERLENGWRVCGALVPCPEHISRPWKHAVLRVASWLLGRHLKRLLKRAMILRTRHSAWTLDRTIVWEGNRIAVRDSLKGLPPASIPAPAPRASRRYIPSANNFHPEDFQLVNSPWIVEQSMTHEDDGWKVETIYSYQPSRPA